MIMPRHLPADAYLDDPADKIDRANAAECQASLIRTLASGALFTVIEWVTRGRGGATNRALRIDIVVLSMRPHLLDCRRPSAASIAREHGVSRQRVSELWREFAQSIDPHLQFCGQRFLNQRRGRVRQGTEGPQPDPVAGA